MKKMKKRSLAAMGVVAAAGVVFGAPSQPVKAAETDMPVDDQLEIASIDDSQSTVEETKAEQLAEEKLSETEESMKEAEEDLMNMEMAVQAAEEAANATRSSAEEAFNEAKSSADTAEKEAKAEVAAAENTAAQAQKDLASAAEQADQADAAVSEASDQLEAAQLEANVTEEDISAKEEELSEASAEENAAAETVAAAEAASAAASEDVQEKETAKEEADATVQEAQAAKAEADEAVSVAEAEAESAAQALSYAEDLRDGSQDIQNTDEYKAVQDAQEAVQNAQNSVESAEEAVSQAESALEEAESLQEEASDRMTEAQQLMEEKDSALAAAVIAEEAALSELESAQGVYDYANQKAEDASLAVSNAASELTEANEAVSEAESRKDLAEKALSETSAALETIRADAESSVNEEIKAAETDYENASEIASAAQVALDQASVQYKQGTLGFIDWMLEKEDLTKDQRQDLQFARDILVETSNEDFTRWYGGTETGLPEERNGKVICIGDQYDATALDNLMKSIDIMKKINEYRASDDNFIGDMQRKESFTNFYFMAKAEAGAMRGAGLMRHSLLDTSTECLSFGYTDPASAWYNKEKADFDRIKQELGITQITSDEDVRRIIDEGYSQNVVVGHYTDLFWSIDQVMGVGYTDYKRTSCYKASNSHSFEDDRQDKAMHMYTIDEFESLALEYLQRIDTEEREKELDSALDAQVDAENRLYLLNEGKEAAIEEKIQNAKDAYETSKQELMDAEIALANANDRAGVASSSAESAQIALEYANIAFSEAEKKMSIAADTHAAAKADVLSAEESAAEARAAAEDAASCLQLEQAAVKAAQENLGEKQRLLDHANQALTDANKNYATAAEKLSSLTSDETIASLTQEKQNKDEILRFAKDTQERASLILEEALEKASSADLALADSTQTAAEKANDLNEAILKKSEITARVQSLTEELNQMNANLQSVRDAREIYEKAVIRAEESRSQLFEQQVYAEEATDILTSAQEKYRQVADLQKRAATLSLDAALKKEIDDEDFRYLNSYVDEVHSALADLEEALNRQAAAEDTLSARQTDYENAYTEYLHAAASLAVAKSRVELETVPAQAVELPADSRVPAEADLVPVEPSGLVYTSGGVDTGDHTQTFAAVASLLASTGLIAVILKRKEDFLSEK